MYRIILASESPRRKEIMKIMGIPYEVLASNVDEAVEKMEPGKMVQALARQKTSNVRSRLGEIKAENDNVIIIGADTMVFYQGHALGKPKDKKDAVRILQMLSDDTHEVYTGVSIIIRNKDGRQEDISFDVRTEVVVQPLSEKQIEDYISTGEPMDKAGAYGIQGSFGIHIKEIAGDYYNVVGFPIAKIYENLFSKGIDIKNLK